MNQFLHMGGYAYFVWSSFAFGILCIAYIYFSAKLSEKENFEKARLWNLSKIGKQVKFIEKKSNLRFVFPLLALLIPLIRLIEVFSR